MRALPDMVVINPCDYNQTKAATIAAAEYNGPVYLRFGRPGVPNFTEPDAPFQIGKIYVMNEGRMVAELSAEEATQERIMAEILHSQGGVPESDGPNQAESDE